MLQRSKNRSLPFMAKKLLARSEGRMAGRHWLTFAGSALGVFALLTVSSVMNGFSQDMRQRVIGTRSEIRLDKADSSPIQNYDEILGRLQKLPYIRAASPVIRNELMLVNGSSMAATICFGIDLEKHHRVSSVLLPVAPEALSDPESQWLQGIVSGNPDTLRFNRNGIILGAELAQSLGASRGDTIRLVSPLGSIPTPLGLLPRNLSLRVEGIFIAGMPDYDRLYSYISLANGQYFSGYNNAIDNVDIKTNNPRKLFQITSMLRKEFPGYRVENWSSFDTSLYQAMHFEKYLMLVVLGLIFIIASFNMSGNIFRTIVQKRKTIGILKTIGYENRELLLLFMRQGLTIAVSGILAGILLSLLVLYIQSTYSIIRLPVGNLPSLVLPVSIHLADFITIPLAALLISLLSIYLPARSAASVNPIALIREIT